MNIATALIRGNGKFDVLTFERDGAKFVVFAKQTAGECRTGKVSVYIKANSEKAQRIGFFQDTFSIESLQEYVNDELIEA